MANQLRSSAENHNWTEPSTRDESREFFARWQHRKYQTELLSRTTDSLPATRFSRLLHKLELKDNRRAKLRDVGLEALQIGSRREQTAPEQTETDDIKEIVFDIRHEELDAAMPRTKKVVVPPLQPQEDDEEPEIVASHSQQPTPIANILADKSYLQTKQPLTPVVTEVDAPLTVVKAYKPYIIYGFLAGLVVVILIAINTVR